MTLGPTYQLPDLRPFRTIQNRMRLQGGAVVTEHGRLESEDFVAGVSGWQINGVGDAEFNDVDVRGTVKVGLGEIDSVDGLTFPSEHYYGFSSPFNPIDRGPQAVSIIGRDGDVIAQFTGVEYSVTQLGAMSYQRSEVYGIDEIFLNSPSLHVGTGSPSGSQDLLGAWETYTPTRTNFTLGNGVEVARYWRIGKTIVLRYSVVWGSTTSFPGGVPSWTLPVSASTSGEQTLTAHLLEENTKEYPASATIDPSSPTTFSVYHPAATGSGNLGPTSPFTWGTPDVNDIIVVQGIYEAA